MTFCDVVKINLSLGATTFCEDEILNSQNLIKPEGIYPFGGLFRKVNQIYQNTMFSLFRDAFCDFANHQKLFGI